MPAPVVQVKRGALLNLPGLRAGEPAFTTDSFDFYVGIDSTTDNNKFVGSHRYWSKETASKGSGINLVESTGGSDFITLAAPASVGAAVTYYFPATQGINGTVLTNDGNGNLSWGSGSNDAIFSGITTFSDTTDSIDKDTGAIIVEGGIGIEKSVNIGGNLGVTGVTTLGQLVTVNNGISASGFSTFYNLQISNNLGVSGYVDVDKHIDVSQGAIIAGIVSFTDTTNATNKDSGAIRIDGGVGIDKDVYIGGSLNVSNNVSIGGSFVSIGAVDVYIENKDIILGYTTSVTPNDDTANHAGIAIASTEGSPIANFPLSGINTLPNTYKQLMWFKSGTLGFSTDAFAFNYGLAVGTTTMANGVRLAVGSGITMSDTEVSASNFYGTFNGSISGNADTATALQSAQNFSITGDFVTASSVSFDGTAAVALAATITENSIILGTYTSGDYVASITSGAGLTGGTTGEGSTPTLAVGAGEGITVNADDVALKNGTNLTDNTILKWDNSNNQLTNTIITENGTSVTIGTGVGVTQFSSAVGSGNSASSVPTSQAVIDYVTSFDMDDDLSVAGDTGGTLTIDFDTETLTIAGTPNEIETVGAGNSITIGLPDTVNITTALDVPTVEATNLKAKDGTTSITITDGTGAVGFANSVTISGDLYVLGTTTEVNTSTLKVEDTLIDLGLVDDGGVLVPPSSDLNLDVGVLMNWYDSSAKKASVFWDDSVQRIGIASDVTEATGVLTVNNWAAIEIGALWVNDCAGQSQVISCTSGERFLNNITVDAGSF